MALDETEPLTLATYRDALSAQLVAGGTGLLAEVTSAGPDRRIYAHTYDGDAWCRFLAASGRDICGEGVIDPMSRLPVTWVTMFCWSPGRGDVVPLYDSQYTPVGSLSYLLARAMLDLNLSQTAAAWAGFGWVVGHRLGLSALCLPDVPLPLELAGPLLLFAARTGDEDLAARCLSTGCSTAVREAAGRWAAQVGSRDMFERLTRRAATPADIDDLTAEIFEETREGEAWGREQMPAQALLRHLLDIFPAMARRPRG